VLWFFDHTLPVQFETTPDRFHWTFGDGSRQWTTQPGAPYPSMDITHVYQHAGPYEARVDVTWGHVRFKVEGGTWQASNQHPTTRGIPVTLTVDELHPRLGAAAHSA
jgi:PKD domain